MMDDFEEHALVIKALTDGLGGCVEWDDRSATKVRNDPDLSGFTPEFIRRALIHLVRNGSLSVQQVPEKRAEWGHYRFYYKAILPFKEFRHGLFVELRMVDADDPEYPVVLLVNAHPERKS
jgi:hypothetical protein